MAFKKITEQKRDQRILALLLGDANTGKSTLLAQLPTPIAGVDSDGRMDEIAQLVSGGELYAQENLAEANDIDKALEWLEKNMPDSGVQSIVWDSITPVLLPIINRALDLAAMSPDGRKAEIGTANKSAVWEPKARAMRKIQSIQNYGVHCVWTAHYEPGRDHQGKEHERKTIPETELDRFTKVLNMKLRTIYKDGKYGVVIEWLRKRPGMKPIVLWDEAGYFKGMWERILAVTSDNPKPEEPVTWADFGIDKAFPSPEVAIQLGTEQFEELPDGVKIYAFGDSLAKATKKNGDEGTNGVLVHARNAYEKLKRGEYEGFKKPTSAGEMAEAWKALVARKIVENKKKQLETPKPKQEEAQPAMEF
jgi:hypothetical protein